MFHILGFLFVIIVVILVIGLSIIGTVLRTVFGLGKRRSSSGTYQNGGGSYQPVEVILSRVINNKMLLRNPTEKQLPLEMISIENTRNFSLKMKENTWILKKLKSNQIFAMPVRMYLPLRLFSFI
mgnify:CR=1 FL=1